MKSSLSLCRWLLVTSLCLLFHCGAHAATLQTSFDENGLATLRYGDLTLTDTRANGDDAFSLYDLDGTSATKVWDAPSQTLIYKYGWGDIACQYTQRGDQLDLDISIANRSGRAVGGFNLFPLGLRFESLPKGYDVNTPHVGFNSDGPTIQSADFGSGILTVINRDVQSPLAVGLIPINNSAQNCHYSLYVGSANLWFAPGNWPQFNRPVPAGGRDNYQISLRFSPPGTNSSHVAADINAQYAAAHPSELSWDDRRPIGALFLSSASDAHPDSNPRGWFHDDATIDAHSAAGRATLRQRVMDFADESIAQLQSVGAQGMITWDIEGQQYPHATSYIGDPRLTAQLAPEMETIADEYFARFRRAGLRVGVCVRPQQLVLQNGDAAQTEVADVAAQLIEKIQYAKTRWGATLFYVDSNGGPYDPTDAAIFRRVARAHSDVLLIPEHQNAAYYAYCAPFNQSNESSPFTPDEVRAIYPDAFSVVKLMGDDYNAMRAALLEAARHGDILMFNGWYDSPDGAAVRAAYAQLGRELRVTTTLDVVDESDGQTSLREAMNRANARNGAAEISFAPHVRGSIRLSGTALPLLQGNCTIVGPGARVLAINGVSKSGIFRVGKNAQLTLSGLTLRGGNAGNDSGGGAIDSEGALTLRDCYFTRNIANNGGAIFQRDGVAALERCTFYSNSARARGGAIYSENNRLSLLQCTLVNNISPNPAEGGGAICADSVELSVKSCTISNNRAGSGGGFWLLGGTLALHNSIVAGNGALDVRMEGGSLSSGGYNLVGAATSSADGAWKASDKLRALAGLERIAHNGGQTPTCALQVGGAAINAGDPTLQSGTDQRGLARVCGARADIGAVEMPASLPVAAVAAPIGGSGGSS